MEDNIQAILKKKKTRHEFVYIEGAKDDRLRRVMNL